MHPHLWNSQEPGEGEKGEEKEEKKEKERKKEEEKKEEKIATWVEQAPKLEIQRRMQRAET